MTAKRYSAVACLSSLASLLFLLHCAEVAPPPGGEEDKQPPIVIETSPVNGAINVTPGREIIFWFSEGIVRPASTRPVFIAPRQKQPPEISWKSDRLVVKLAEPFDSNQTYVVTLTSEIADWRRNKLDSTVTIAFSTGEKIDSGAVSGFILTNGNSKSGILAGLYEVPLAGTEIEYDSVYPAYLSQSATDGSFRFRFLPEKTFQLIAFEDINRSETYNHKEEPFATSDRNIEIGGTRSLDGLYLELSNPAGVEPALVSASFTVDGLIRIRLNTKLQLGYLKDNLNGILLSLKSNPSQTYNAQALLESHQDTSSVLNVFTRLLDTGSYIITVPYDSTAAALTFDSLTVGEKKDKSAPLILEFSPDDRAHFKKDIEMAVLFSEPVDRTKLTSGTFVLMNDAGQTVIVQSNWSDPFHLAFHSEELEEGRNYTMNMAEFEIADLAGNLLGDSIQSFSFSVLDTDSLGSVSGTVLVEVPNKTNSVKKLSFTSISGKESYDIKVPDHNFTTELPAGKYLMAGFLDDNNNGRRDVGSVRPYSFAETFTRSADTISVRARFETTGIGFTFK